MSSFFADYLERLEMLHTEMEQALTGLPQAALDWSPGPKMNSLAVLAAHIAGSEMFWIGDLTVRGATTRIRETEFQTKDATAEALQTRLAQALADSRAVLTQLTLANLEEQRTSPRDGEVYTVAWCLLHGLEHTAMHVGHMQLARQLWEEQHRG
ncbi:MAG: DinB family protein [Caldilineaceae bacterium]